MFSRDRDEGVPQFATRRKNKVMLSKLKNKVGVIVWGLDETLTVIAP